MIQESQFDSYSNDNNLKLSLSRSKFFIKITVSGGFELAKAAP